MNKVKEFFKNPIFQMISKIMSWTVLALLILIATFLVYYVISAKIYESKGEKFQPQFSLYTIVSSSMEPNILVYDVVFDTKVSNINDLKVGDVITFCSTSSITDGMTITHRIVGIIETDTGVKLRTKGDGNIAPDSSLVDGSHILGKVAFKLPQLGRVQFLLQSKGGWLFALLIPAMGVVIYDVMKVIRLSGIKKNIKDANKKDEDLDLKKNEEELKEKLRAKFINVVPVNTIVDNVEVDDKKETEDTKEQPIIKTEENSLDLSKVLKNIQKLDDDETNIELPEEDIELPKIKK